MQTKILLMTAAVASVLLAAPSSFGVGLEGAQTAATPSSQAASAPQDGAAAVTDPALGDEPEPAALQLVIAQQLAQARQQQLTLLQLRRQLAAAEVGNGWLPGLGLALLGMVGLSGWLAVQLRRLRHQHRLQALRASALAQAQAEADAPSASQDLASGGTPLFSAQAPLVSGAMPVQRSAQAPLATGPAVGDFRSSSPQASTASLAPIRPAAGSANTLSFGTGVPPRPVSVEELLDLEQQVDFFIVLGQEQAAVELLLSHVRATGGASALPYFKLLQIYRQQGDEEAYERTRDRFNQRFNALAPDWQGDLAAGRCLEHYPEVLARLQQAWPQPLRALAELESLLLRRADLDAFDLPAFHDILTLHALVRDLPAMQESPTVAAPVQAAAPAAVQAELAGSGASTTASDVDVLLPLDDNRPTEITQAQPRMAESGGLARAMLADWVLSRAAQRPPTGVSGLGTQALPEASNSPPVKLDLDLTDFGPAPREFTRPAAFTDVDLRRDSRLSDLAGFEDSDLLPPSITRR